eukprot:TRINITY_DN18416_c0_g1_i1.p2 TRINITY_DN18416_c0_g1~~TRINITY_DN18416_c0_g1_i1.p2  ORF type:complete len:120 (-),score=35.19 TRINITY_DN18416_c0_g1_i1:129-488(-)
MPCGQDEFAINYKNASVFRVSRTNGTCSCAHFESPGAVFAASVNATQMLVQSLSISGNASATTLRASSDVIINGTSVLGRLRHLQELLANQTSVLAAQAELIANQTATIDALLNCTGRL